ncbi:MAG: type III pantothenate kinase, partial [Gammaproteobacteria bacterium]|nr:type III pantothenate kinase [Gammaproteobacteria bacterium]
MKTLLIDAGNSHLKWAWLTRQGMIQDAATAAYDASTTQVLDAAWLDMLPPQRVLVASVVPRFTTELTRWLAERWGCPVECVQSQAQGFGVTSGYQQPATLGVDRWLAMIAARDYGEEVCIYDCGTALTIDVLIQGRHQGGLIFPGSRLLQRSLWQG